MSLRGQIRWLITLLLFVPTLGGIRRVLIIFWIFLNKFESLPVLALCCGCQCGGCSSRECSQQWWIVHLLSSSGPQSEEQNVITKIITNGISCPMYSSNKGSCTKILHPSWHIQDAMMPTYPIKHHEIVKNDELWPWANEEMALLLLSDQLKMNPQLNT